MERERRKC